MKNIKNKLEYQKMSNVLLGTAIGENFYSVEDFDRLIELDSQLYNRTSYLFFLRRI